MAAGLDPSRRNKEVRCSGQEEEPQVTSGVGVGMTAHSCRQSLPRPTGLEWGSCKEAVTASDASLRAHHILSSLLSILYVLTRLVLSDPKGQVCVCSVLQTRGPSSLAQGRLHAFPGRRLVGGRADSEQGVRSLSCDTPDTGLLWIPPRHDCEVCSGSARRLTGKLNSQMMPGSLLFAN